MDYVLEEQLPCSMNLGLITTDHLENTTNRMRCETGHRNRRENLQRIAIQRQSLCHFFSLSFKDWLAVTKTDCKDVAKSFP